LIGASVSTIVFAQPFTAGFGRLTSVGFL